MQQRALFSQSKAQMLRRRHADDCVCELCVCRGCKPGVPCRVIYDGHTQMVHTTDYGIYSMWAGPWTRLDAPRDLPITASWCVHMCSQEDYVEAAVKQALTIHLRDPAGDVLIFMTGGAAGLGFESCFLLPGCCAGRAGPVGLLPARPSWCRQERLTSPPCLLPSIWLCMPTGGFVGTTVMALRDKAAPLMLLCLVLAVVP